jgi:hypothetical protein
LTLTQLRDKIIIIFNVYLSDTNYTKGALGAVILTYMVLVKHEVTVLFFIVYHFSGPIFKNIAGHTHFYFNL